MDEVLEARRARWRVRVGAAVVLVLVAIGCAVLVSALSDRGGAEVVSRGEPTASADFAPSTIVVHVLGAVAHAGVYELPQGARAIDAIAAAGGFADDADRGQLNLARFLADGEQVHVPVAGEASSVPGVASDGRVNLNTADRAALETLPRVGPALADRIIAWREANGPFASVDDLLAVAGIGEKTLAGFRDLVTT